MTMPEPLCLRFLNRAARRARRGFALIVTLSLMTLLLLLVLALTTLVQLNLNAAKTTLYNTQAKQNALLAAYIAIGQLQKFAGPDQRVTTTADIGRLGDNNDASAQAALGGQFIAVGLNSLNASPKPVSPTPAPFGAGANYSRGGTRYWTAIWGQGTNPLSLYTGQDTNGNVTPQPILMNWLVSGNENTPLVANTFIGGKAGNGVVQPLASQYPNFSSDTTSIFSKGSTDTTTWNALTSDISIQPKNSALPPQPAVVLVGPNSAGTNVNTPTQIKSGKGGPTSVLNKINEANNLVVVPVVTINEPSESTSGTVATGRYAYFVQDEGVKAKYNIVDPYSGLTAVSNITPSAPLSRYRYATPLRTGIERMFNMDTYVSNGTAYNGTVASEMNNLLDPSELLLIDNKLTGLTNPSLPQQTLQLHYHDFTTYSYGVIADALRSGLRYDLTAAFEPGAGSTAVFTDTNNGLKGRTIIPAATAAPATLPGFTTEPNAANTTGLFKNADGVSSNFHGPAAPDLINRANPGLKWDVLQSFYNIATTNTGTQLEVTNGTAGAQTPAVAMRSATSTQAGISPVILQARLRFGQYADNTDEEYIAVQPLFVLANPYNFPITDPGGGLDLGFRINTDTKWEWGFAPSARNNDRVTVSPGFPDTATIPGTDHTSGVGFVLGYDLTQNLINPNIALYPTYQGDYFFSKLASDSANDVAGNGAAYPQTGYYPFLKNPVSYPIFRAPHTGYPGEGNQHYNSALDQVAFHIPHIDSQGNKLIFQPGEAKVFVLGVSPSGNVNANFKVNIRYPTNPNLTLTAVVGTSNGSASATYANTYAGNQIVPVTMTAHIPLPSSPDNLYMLRDTGINTGPNNVLINPNMAGNAAAYQLKYGNNQQLPNMTEPINAANQSLIGNYANSQPWPDKNFGYLSTMFGSVAMTLELRYDMKEPSNNLSFGSAVGVPAGSASSKTNGSYNIAAVGTNLLQSITNLDLTGDGYNSTANTTVLNTPLDLAASMSMTPPAGYRRQYLLNSGTMPVFLSAYTMAMALPGNFVVNPGAAPGQQGLLFYQDSNTTGGGRDVHGYFDPALQGTYRTYYDYNLRAANMALPPFVPMNMGTISSGSGKPATAVLPANPPLPTAAGFINLPPYGRTFDQGLGTEGNAQLIASYGDTAYTGGLGNFSSTTNPTDGANLTADTGWGYAMGGTDGAGLNPGEQFCVLYGLPHRAQATVGGVVTNPNIPGQSIPDVPIISLGQLQHADVTADDVFVSVGYQPGNAIGNSYFNFYVSRHSSVQSHTISEGKTPSVTGYTPNPSGWASSIMIVPPNANGTAALYNNGGSGPTGGSGAGSLLTGSSPANAYDISYLMNVALWDRYFFSTLSQTGATLLPANNRLKYAAGYSPTTDQLGINGSSNTTVKDPATGLNMFRAYAPARYMMIDGAFNINSTSVEAWKAILSAMRGVPYNSTGSPTTLAKGTDNISGSPVTYFPRFDASPDLAAATSYGNPVNGPVAASNLTTGQNAVSYAGFRQLTDYEIDVLANKIVQQVRFRGPFLSLAQFVNRRLTPLSLGKATGDPFSISGAIQTAIDISSDHGLLPSLNAIANATIGNGPNGFSNSTMNSNLLPGKTNGLSVKIYPDSASEFQGPPYDAGSADPFSRLLGMPGWLTQADLLEALGPILAARSDTFVIRTYGEVLNPEVDQKDILNSIAQNPDYIRSRAWCEMVVQRVPDYLATDAKSLNDPSTTSGLGAPNPTALGSYNGANNNLSPVNATFGRRFRIVSVKWLSPTDI